MLVNSFIKTISSFSGGSYFKSYDALTFRKDNITSRMKELSKLFKSHKLSLTATIVDSKDKIFKTLNYSEVIDYFDYLHIMPMPVYPEFEGKTVDQVYRDRDIPSLEHTINGLVSSGIPSKKIVLNLMFSSPVFYVTNVYPSKMKSPLYVDHVDYLGYDRICDLLTSNQTRFTLEKEYNADIGLVILKYYDRIPLKYFVVYENSRSMANRARLAIRRNLGGVAAFPMSLDDYLGKCPIDTDTFADFNVAEGVHLRIPTRKERNFPLLRTIHDALAVALDERNQEARLHH